MISPNSYQKFDGIAELCRDFYAEAEQISRFVVQEVGLEKEKRTIAVIDVGGIAGGVKVRVFSYY